MRLKTLKWATWLRFEMTLIDISVEREEKPEWIIQRWINRGVLDPSSYNRSELIDFINTIYRHLSRTDKVSVGLCLKKNIPLLDITPERLKREKREHSQKAGKAREEKNKQTKTKADYKRTIEKGIQTRIKKYSDLLR